MRLDLWRSAMEKLKIIPHCEIQNTLKISYESLQDDHDRDLFLEIACFFNGFSKTCVIGILDECSYYTTVGIENLVDRCLLTIDKGNKLIMHQLLQDMGREITNQQSPGEPGKRSRLWYYKDSFRVLKEESGTETIEGLAFNMSMLMKDASSMRSFNANEANLKTDAFSRMHKLRLLQINYVQFTGGYKDFPKTLRWLCWHGFPLSFLPSQFPLDSLVAIDMKNSNLKYLWQGNKFLGLLKYLNLSHCHQLVKTPDFSNVPALEHLILKDCISLVEIDESIGIAEGLILLNLRDCKSLKEILRNIGMLTFLEILVISGCSNIQMLPTEEMKKMESLKVFHADGIPFEPLSPTTREKPSWREVIWGWVSRPKIYPQLPWTSLPQSLVRLSLVGCNLSDNAFARVSCNVSSLKYLYLNRNPIRYLPDCFNGLSLEVLSLLECPRLQALAGISNVELLLVRDCALLEEIKFQSNSYLRSYVFPFYCEKLLEFHNCFKLESLDDIDTEIINSLGLYNLESLKSIQIKLVNNYTLARTEGPIQGVYENHEMCDFFSIFFPGNSVPNWFTSRSFESFVSFTVPSPRTAKIRCLNICFVYKIVRRLEYDSYENFYIIVHNLSKDIKIVYGPSCYGIPEEGKYMIWLSQWKFHNQELEAGDELNVSSLMIEETDFEVKEVGTHLVYDDEQVQVADFQSNGGEISQQACANSQYKISPELQPVGYQGSAPIFFVGCCGTTAKCLVEHIHES